MSGLVELRDTPLESLEVESSVAHSSAGAVVSFVGRVRDHNDGKLVTRLEYEAYTSMAQREMTRIVGELEQRLPGVRLAVLHRTGMLLVGEAAIIAAASAAHRAEAFDACRRLVDEVKARVPIWKREYGPDGPYWVGWEDARCDGQHDAPGHHHGHDQARPLAQHEHAQTQPRTHGHHHGHDHGNMVSSVNAQSLGGMRVICITVSDTRHLDDDGSGNVAEQLLAGAGAAVERQLVRDDPAQIAALVTASVAKSPHALLLTGGTGIGPRDFTAETLAPLLERQLDGFGEHFRRLSFDAIGIRAVLSRALAGSIGQVLVFAVPGSPKAVALAVEQLVIPLLPHAQAMVRGGGH